MRTHADLFLLLAGGDLEIDAPALDRVTSAAPATRLPTGVAETCQTSTRVPSARPPGSR